MMEIIDWQEVMCYIEKNDRQIQYLAIICIATK